MSSVGVGFSRGAGQSTIDNLQSGIPRVAGGILQDVPKLPEIGCLSLVPPLELARGRKERSGGVEPPMKIALFLGASRGRPCVVSPAFGVICTGLRNRATPKNSFMISSFSVIMASSFAKTPILTPKETHARAGHAAPDPKPLLADACQPCYTTAPH
jgi:hypothetical protein